MSFREPMHALQTSSRALLLRTLPVAIAVGLVSGCATVRATTQPQEVQTRCEESGVLVTSYAAAYLGGLIGAYARVQPPDDEGAAVRDRLQSLMLLSLGQMYLYDIEGGRDETAARARAAVLRSLVARWREDTRLRGQFPADLVEYAERIAASESSIR